ncbi:hypothetical protein [Salegentibacter salarius]|uniref:Magnesium citrate secondary transporter n=1 Tax=Salegentibacter salarius TaxID=435906 RepID=A0A2N0TQ63_9FLAO|nr:hypothetical protein [Salegentibacter salarius]OEY71625.1 hypothetical protein BHS39_04495 [Salegentibacter salarius]PKD16875.1 hypothetical protein APR40_04495 [Salegentibacter salarius]SLJ91010.1 hypothetical protein SAMN05660445_01077 [Salegentibacter salarius]
MKSLKTVFFLFCLLFVALQTLYFLEQPLPDFINFYLADFLCMPIVLSICLFTVQFLKKDKTLRLNLFTVLSVFVMYAIYFEVILPPLHWRYTADIIDVLLYLIGSFLFYLLQKLP